METVGLLLGMLPALVLWVTAITVAMVRWQHHPMVSTLVLVGGVTEILVSAASMLVPRMIIERGMSAAQVGLVSVPIHLVGMLAMGAVITAVFIGREPANRAPVDPKTIT